VPLMPYGIANHNGEEVEVVFIATCVVTDYGVDRSPTWIEWDNVRIDDLTILGVAVDVSKLPVDLQEAIYALANNLEFEQEDPDYD
jgi:hypothetical protein